VSKGQRLPGRARTSPTPPPAARPNDRLPVSGQQLFPHLTRLAECRQALRPKPAACAAPQTIPRRRCACTGRHRIWQPRNLRNCRAAAKSRGGAGRVLGTGAPLVFWFEPFAALGPALRNDMLDLGGRSCAAENRAQRLIHGDPRPEGRCAVSRISVILCRSGHCAGHRSPLQHFMG